MVVSVGGSVLFTGSGDAEYHHALASLLHRMARRFALVVTTGGGRTAREYIATGRSLGLTEVELDELGIDVTRLHARLLAARIGPPAPPVPPTSLAAAVDLAHHRRLLVLGGTEPGHTTDAVAALLAVRLRAARVVNATRVPGLYDRDPRHDPAARRFDRLSWPEFREIVRRSTDGRAGQEFVFDRPGADALARAGIPLWIVAGRDLTNLGVAIAGGRAVGTLIGGARATDKSSGRSARP
ncbi:MAG: UMP kinase [Thermoplasmata archaeon]|nr:UMP kinase [Thermoplasmata archaeon]